MGIQISTVWQECYKCGIAFGVPECYNEIRRRDGRRFWCPNGHAQCYPKKKHTPAGERSLEDRQQLIKAIHDAEQAEAKAAEGKPPKPEPYTVDGKTIVCQCGKRYVYLASFREHLRLRHGVELTSDQVIGLVT